MSECKYEIIQPKLELQSRLGGPIKPLNDDQVKSVETALQELVSGMGEWLKHDLEQLNRARNAFLDDPQSREKIADLHRASHDLKGLGQTYGFPSVSVVADTLCKVIERCIDKSELHEDLVNAHVDALRAIANLGLRDPRSEPVAELLGGLNRLAEKKIA